MNLFRTPQLLRVETISWIYIALHFNWMGLVSTHTSLRWAGWWWLALDEERGRREGADQSWPSRSVKLGHRGETEIIAALTLRWVTRTCLNPTWRELLANLIWFHCSYVSVPQASRDCCSIPPEQFHILCVSSHSITRSLTDACNFVWRQCHPCQ